MHVDDLTPLDQIPTFTEADREALRPYWITTAEEFIATARLRNGIPTLGTLLARTPTAIQELFDAATHASRLATAFTTGTIRDYPTGLILDDDRDAPAVAFTLPTTPLPPEASLLNLLPPVQDQGKRNTCVAFALVAMVQCLRGDPTDLSEQFLFWRCKAHDQIPHDPSGTKPAVAARQLVDVGVCREDLWRYHAYEIGDGGAGGDAPNVGQGPPPHPDILMADAAGRRIGGYRPIDRRNVNAIRAEIVAGRPVMIGLRIAAFWSRSTQATKLGRVRRLLPGEEWEGGHALCAVGYRNDANAPGGGYFIVRNSWGAGWASENPDGPGYAHVPYQLIADENSVALVLDMSSTPSHAVSAEHTTEPAVALMGSGGGVVGESLHDDTLLNTLTTQAAGLSSAGLSRLIVALATRLADALNPMPLVLPSIPPVVEHADILRDESIAPLTPALLPVGETRTFIEKDGPLIIPNGIDPTIGRPRYRFDLAGARTVAESNRWDNTAAERMLHAQVARRNDPVAGMIHGFSYDQLNRNTKDAQGNAGAGWGLVVPADEDATLLKALTPLITQRCADQGIAPPDLTFESGETCGAWLRRVGGDAALTAPMQGSKPIPIFLYNAQVAESAGRWCARHGVTINPVDPRRGVPFYLLLVGRPGARIAGDPHIPFSFQYDLDFYWGVGRLCFTDAQGNHRYDAYTAYAERLVAIERGQTPARTRSVAYFATHHPLDPSTALSATELVGPLLHGDAGREPMAERFRFATDDITDKATRASLERMLIGADAADRPALLFSATHGIDFPFGHPDQIMQQGALLCQDWDGLDLPQRAHWLAGADLPDATHVMGLVAVCFACFGLGCPAHDQFRFERTVAPQAIAPYPFVAQLPQRLLERGALAVLGHVDRAWSYSFRDEMQKVPGQSQAFEDLLGGILDGKRLGEATDQFNTRQGQTAMDLTDLLDSYRFAAANGSQSFGLEGIGPRWAAFSDARGYSLLGDPAVRLHVQD